MLTVELSSPSVRDVQMEALAPFLLEVLFICSDVRRLFFHSVSTVNFNLPPELLTCISRLDDFIHNTIIPLQHQDDNNRFLDPRREHFRINWEEEALQRPNGNIS